MSNEAKILSAIGVATLVIVVGAAFLFGGKSNSPEPAKLTEDQTKLLVKGDSHTFGNKDAKVTIVEFADFQCPACAATQPILNQLIKDYEKEVRFVFRHFPLAMHKNARSAAEAAEAAGKQGKFSEMANLLYENQKDWGESNDPMAKFEEYAKLLDLDIEKFKAEVTGKKSADKIQADVNDGSALGVSATPTFFINGEKQSGGLPYDQFKVKIDAILKK